MMHNSALPLKKLFKLCSDKKLNKKIAKMFAAYLLMKQIQSDISIQLESCFSSSDEFISLMFTHLLTLVSVSTSSGGGGCLTL